MLTEVLSIFLLCQVYYVVFRNPFDIRNGLHSVFVFCLISLVYSEPQG